MYRGAVMSPTSLPCSLPLALDRSHRGDRQDRAPRVLNSRARGLRAMRVIATAFGALLMVLLGAGNALAAGSFSIKTPSVDEKNGEWHVKVRIDLSRPPGMMHTPMRFTFSKEAVDERAIMSKGAEPEHHRMVLDTSPKQIVGLDVDFADASGKVFKSTYFEFDLSRKDGYFEAGEYLVTLSGADGEVGTAQKLTLKGDNPPVYRGAMDFTADPKAQKQRGPKMESVSNGLDGGGAKSDPNDTTSAGPASTEVAASGPAPAMVPSTAYDRTTDEEALRDHPKGCGCVAAGMDRVATPSTGFLLLGLGLGFGLVVARRRKPSHR
jgi:hypothetical protein